MSEQSVRVFGRDRGYGRIKIGAELFLAWQLDGNQEYHSVI